MKDLKTIESRVRAILSNHQEARDDDMILYLLYCNRYGEVRVGELPFEMVMNNYKVFHIPCFESVRRTRQKIQAATPELGCSPDVRRARRKQQSDLTGAAGSTDGTLLPNEGEVPEGKPKSSVLQSPDELQVERASDGSGTDGDRTDGTLDERASGERGRDGEPESNRYDELGSTDEQHSQSGSGNGVEASSLRLDYYDRSNEDKSLPFFGGDDTVREILGTTPHLKASKDEIRAFFENVADDDKRTEYIKSIFNNDYTEVILSDDRRVGYKTYQNVLHLWEGSYLSRTAQSTGVRKGLQRLFVFEIRNLQI